MNQPDERHIIVRGTNPQQFLVKRGRKWLWGPLRTQAHIVRGQGKAQKLADRFGGQAEPITPETDIERARQEAALTAAFVIWESYEAGRFSDIGDTNPLGDLIIEIARQWRDEYFVLAGPVADEWMAKRREQEGGTLITDLPRRLAHAHDDNEQAGEDNE